MNPISQDALESGILLVDDEHNILKLLRRLLNHSGFTTVNTALNAEQGLTIIRNADKPFSVILSDQHMPGMNGYTFFKKAREISPDSRRILITGFRDFNAAMDAINQGGIHKYITKPWDESELLSMLISEIEAYHSVHEKKRLRVIIKNQNTQLYRLAQQMSREKKEFKKQEAARKEQLASIKKVLKEFKNEDAMEKMPPGLDLFFSDKKIQDHTHLVRAFEIINDEINTILGSIARKHTVSFSPESNHPHMEEGTSNMPPPDYELIDRIIGIALKRTAPLLANIHPSFGDQFDIASYTTVPDILELAQKEGLIEAEQIRLIQEQTAREGNGVSTQRQIGEILTASGMLSRLDVSRLVVKRQFIQARILDQACSRKLIDQKVISSGALEICLSEQMMRFKRNGECIPLRDILLEKNMIDRQTWKKMFKNAAEAQAVPDPSKTTTETRLSEEQMPIELIVSNNATKAWIKNKEPLPEEADTTMVKTLLEKRGVIYGVIEDENIATHLDRYRGAGEKWIVAESIIMPPETDGKIEYLINPQDRRPGIFKKDGTIDFKDRGDIPFVKKGALLAKKTLWEKIPAGRNVLGEHLRLEPQEEVALKAGVGTVLSEDGLSLYAANEGEPCLDSRGIISVYQELIIKKDVDFETGHIDFQGNVFVNGNIKDGFKVSCANLTVSEINGGIISTTGDLKVSKGIIDAQVSTLGSVTARFVNKSTIKALGNMTVTRDIMESAIAINGQFTNKAGRIISSSICAKMGFFIRLVGTEKSEPSILKPGGNDYLDQTKEELLEQEKKAIALVKGLTPKKKHLEEQNFSIHEKIMAHSYSFESLKKDEALLQAQLQHAPTNKKADLEKEYKKIQSRVKVVEKSIKALFDTQDTLMAKIEASQETIQKLLDEQTVIAGRQGEIERLKESQKGIPRVQISKQIQAGTRIIGPNSAIKIQQNTGACKILEVEKVYGSSPAVKEMVIRKF